jgi:hypothetical protein
MFILFHFFPRTVLPNSQNFDRTENSIWGSQKVSCRATLKPYGILLEGDTGLLLSQITDMPILFLFPADELFPAVDFSAGKSGQYLATLFLNPLGSKKLLAYIYIFFCPLRFFTPFRKQISGSQTS